MKKFYLLLMVGLVFFSCTDALLKDNNDSSKSSNNSNIDNPVDDDVKYGLKGMIYGFDKEENSKHIIKNAKISFINKEKKIEKTIISDSYGRYKLDLPYGKYEVLISFYNYETLYTENEYIIVEKEGHKIIDFVLNKLNGNTGLQGGVWERLENGKIGKKLSCTKIVFYHKDGKGKDKKTVYSDQNGRYRIILPEGKYQVHVFHKDYKPYILTKGYIIVINGRFQTSNYFLLDKNK